MEQTFKSPSNLPCFDTCTILSSHAPKSELMAPRYHTSDLPKRFVEIRPDEHDTHDLPHDSGYQSSDGSDQLSRGSNELSADQGGHVRPPKKRCVPPSVPPRYLCGTCKTLFDAFEDLAQHIKAKSTTCAASDGHWMCGKCEDSFTEGRSLKRHVTTTGCVTGTTKTPHICHTCGKEYGRLDNLKRHEKKHRGQNRRKNLPTKTIPSSLSGITMAQIPGESVASSSTVTRSISGSESRCEAVQMLHSGSSNLGLQLHYFPQPTGRSIIPVTAKDIMHPTSTTSTVVPATASYQISVTDSGELAPFATAPRHLTYLSSLNLPIRPKHAGQRPGPKRRLIKCPSCRKKIGLSQQELEAHAKSHLGGRYSVDLLCRECMICFEREEDFRHHLVSAKEHRDCGFKFEHHRKCDGHHPLDECEVFPNPDGDHARMRIAVQKWELLGLQDYQLQHDEVAKALPDQGEDCGRWSLAAISVKANSLWTLRSKPVSKTSAPSRVDYTAKIPFRNLAVRYEQVKAATALKYLTRKWQIERRTDLAAVGAIMAMDFHKLAQILREGRDPNARLYTVDTGAANMRYNEQLCGRHNYFFPLILASEQGFLDGMSLLICAGADIHAVDDNCRTALDWAMARQNKLACAVLLAHGARYVDRGDREVEDARVFLQAAKDEMMSDLIFRHRERPPALACYAHHAILHADEISFGALVSFGFSAYSEPLCPYHDLRTFGDLAKSAAPHLLGISHTPEVLDLEHVVEAITANCIPAIRTFLTPGIKLPFSVCSVDALTAFARSMPGVTQEVIDVLEYANRGVGLSKAPKEDYWYSRFGVDTRAMEVECLFERFRQRDAGSNVAGCR